MLFARKHLLDAMKFKITPRLVHNVRLNEVYESNTKLGMMSKNVVSKNVVYKNHIDMANTVL